MPTTNGHLYGPGGEVLTFAEEVPSDDVMESVVGRPSFKAFQSLLGAMPEIDDLEAKEGEDIWDRMLDDGHVWAAVFQLRNRILSKEWDLVPADDSDAAAEVAGHVRSELRSVDFQKALEHLLQAVTHKYSVVELVWGEPEGGGRSLRRIKRHYKDHFRLGRDGQLFFDLPGMDEVPPFKFAWMVAFPKPTRPHGRSLLQAAYWPWRFKQMGYESWSMALDKMGVPSLVALAQNVDASSEQGQQTLDTIAADLQKVADGSSAALSSIEELQEVGGAGQGFSGFTDFMKFNNAEISKAILTATLQLEEGRDDAERGNTQVHNESAEDVARYVAGLLEDRVTEQIAKPVSFLEFGERGEELAPRLRFDFKERASFDEVEAAMENGVPLSRNLLEQDYNLPLAEEEADDAFVSPQFNRGPALQAADSGKKKPNTGLTKEDVLPTPSTPAKSSPSRTKSKAD